DDADGGVLLLEPARNRGYVDGGRHARARKRLIEAGASGGAVGEDPPRVSLDQRKRRRLGVGRRIALPLEALPAEGKQGFDVSMVARFAERRHVLRIHRGTGTSGLTARRRTPSFPLERM